MSGRIELLKTRAEARAWREKIARSGARVGFVPTMGALHAGHASLLKRARATSDVSLLSIFVNPTQFGPSEDLAKYPRTLERDLELARAEGVDVVFTPTEAEMYPEGFSTYVEETRLEQPLCGLFRPGHFRGVATIVLKLFNLLGPEAAYFGLKDAQQFFVLSRMARDLDLATRVVGLPTVREADGLALSSRNAYLSPRERQTAPELARALNATRDALTCVRPGSEGGALVAAATAGARARLESFGFGVQYVECLELPELAPATRLAADRPYLIAAAAHLGATRLIDNVLVAPEKLAAFGINVELG